MVDIALKVEGLIELNRALRAADPAIQKEMNRELRDVVGGPVVRDVRRRVPTRSGRAARSVRVRANQKGITLIGGKAAVPYFGWLEYGGVLAAVGGRRNTQTRPVVKDGRYIRPAIEANKQRIISGVEAGVARALKRANL